ncbi:hypothetical protein Aam_231_002 [Acidocella aminolytica 101 = DSM 11237]|uniref:Uncharacterized protein n=1 Tax=Acidocella aminolytica 101 = DSM 11237 TaxID=1120923 RepID=A0A0D6PN90_9PROT|nr:hypothetical protein Aam_231_002 [Acidocella aminolytica 101 = DSM 11237]
MAALDLLAKIGGVHLHAMEAQLIKEAHHLKQIASQETRNLSMQHSTPQ